MGTATTVDDTSIFPLSILLLFFSATGPVEVIGWSNCLYVCLVVTAVFLLYC
jgi:hypothetical protein